MKAQALRSTWVIPLVIVVMASAVYQFTTDKKEISGANTENAIKANITSNNKSVDDAVFNKEYSQNSPDDRPVTMSHTQSKTDDLQTNESNDHVNDTKHNVIRLPSELFYNTEFRDTLIASIKNGTMTFSQRRDFYTALNHPLIPTADKNLLYMEFMLAFQQRKITPEQMFGYAE